LATTIDRSEFLQMVDNHGAAVLALLRRLCGNMPDAEDAFQETAVRVWKSFDRRPPLRNPRAWLMAIAYRAFVDLHARRRHGDVLTDVADFRTHSPGDAAVKVEEATQVGTAIEELSENLRQVVVLHYTGGLTLQETATALDIPIGTVKSRLGMALTKLRSILS
jgi:RNA polymerase sigma-70 factor, ECF subfamily